MNESGNNILEFGISNPSRLSIRHDLIVVLTAITAILIGFNGSKWISLLLIIFYTLKRFNQVLEERVLVLKDVGVQVCTKYLTGTRTYFVEQSNILNFILNEGLYGWEIRYYLAIVTEKRLIVLFEHILPRLNTILPMYHKIKNMGLISNKQNIGMGFNTKRRTSFLRHSHHQSI